MQSKSKFNIGFSDEPEITIEKKAKKNLKMRVFKSIYSSEVRKKRGQSFEDDSEIYKQFLIDVLTMDPIEKWVKYDMKPYQLFLKIGQVVIISFAMWSLSLQFNGYQRCQQRAFQQQLYSTGDYNLFNFYTIPTFQQNVANLQHICQPNNNIYFQALNCTTQTAYATATMFNINNRLNSNKTLTFAQSFTQQLDIDTIQGAKHFYQSYQTLIIQIRNVQFIMDENNQNLFNCWDLDVYYTVRARSAIVGQAKFVKHSKCNPQNINKNKGFLSKEVKEISYVNQHLEQDSSIDQSIKNTFKGQISIVIPVLVILLSIISLLLHFKIITKMINYYIELRILNEIKNSQSILNGQTEHLEDFEKEIMESIKAEKEEELTFLKKKGMQRIAEITRLIQLDQPWQQISLQQKMVLFDNWLILNIISNSLYILTFMIGCQSDYNMLNSDEMSYQQQTAQSTFYFLLGLSAGFSWLNLIEYIQFIESLNKTFVVLRKTVPVLGQFFIGVIPIFIAFVIIGMSLFSDRQYFMNFSTSINSLFAMMVGDQVSTFLLDLKDKGFMGQGFLMTYVTFSMLILHSMIVAIIVSKAEKQICTPESGKGALTKFFNNNNNNNSNMLMSSLRKTSQLSNLSNSPKLSRQNSAIKENQGSRPQLLKSKTLDLQQVIQSQKNKNELNQSQKIAKEKESQKREISKQITESLTYNKIYLSDFQLDSQIHQKKSKFIRQINKSISELNNQLDIFSDIQLDDVEYFRLTYDQKLILVHVCQDYLNHVNKKLIQSRQIKEQ